MILFLQYWIVEIGELFVAGLYGVILFLWYWMGVIRRDCCGSLWGDIFFSGIGEEGKLLRVSML